VERLSRKLFPRRESAWDICGHLQPVQEYFRAVHERYQQAGREAKDLMLNEFCLNTGYHRKTQFVFWTDLLLEKTGAAAARMTAALWPASPLHLGSDLGSRGISLVGAAEGLAAQLDALDSQTLPDDHADGEAAAGHQRPANRPEGGSGKRF
jgi:hypothetical protein